VPDARAYRLTPILDDVIGELGVRVLAAGKVRERRADGIAEGWGSDRLRAPAAATSSRSCG
jgi:hypothetical protein